MAGRAHDKTILVPLLDGADNSVVDGDGMPVALAGEMGYRSDWIDSLLLKLGVKAVIFSKKNEVR